MFTFYNATQAAANDLAGIRLGNSYSTYILNQPNSASHLAGGGVSQTPRLKASCNMIQSPILGATLPPETLKRTVSVLD